MNERSELERSLRGVDAGPGEQVREKVLRAFDDGRSARPRARIPSVRFTLRAVAAIAVLAIAFLAGRWSAPTAPLPLPSDRGEVELIESALACSPASRDLLRID